MSLVDGHLAVSRLPNTDDIPLSIAIACTVPHVTPIVSHWLYSTKHL